MLKLQEKRPSCLKIYENHKNIRLLDQNNRHNMKLNYNILKGKDITYRM